MKKSLVLLLALLLTLSLASCIGSDEPSNNYPDGAVALTADNISDYFDIKVTTRCQYDYDFEATRAESYVSLVPKGNYSQVVGQISFELNARVRQYGTSYGDSRVSLKTEKLRLDDGVINTTIVGYISGGGVGVSREYVPIESTNNITLLSVEGYFLPGSAKTPEHEEITESQRLESDAILAELRERVDSFARDFDTAENYQILAQTKTNLSSIFGDGLSVKRTATHFSLAVDIPGERFFIGDSLYYKLGGVSVSQSRLPNGMYDIRKSGMTLDGAIAEATPSFDVFDADAVYMRDGYNGYVAITTLKKMADGDFKTRIINALDDHGVTTRYDKMTVKYYYGFDGASFLFSASVDYTDYRYHVDYFRMEVETVQKISDVNNTTVQEGGSPNQLFAPQETLEDAMLFDVGAITLKRGDSSIYLTTYSSSYEGYTHTTVKNYFPLVIEESGLYTLSPEDKTIMLYDENGRLVPSHVNVYLTRGKYYLAAHSVLYGTRTVRVIVSAAYYEDYGELSDPTPIENDAYSFNVEGIGDRIALSYTPDKSGIYSLGCYESIEIGVYEAEGGVYNELFELYSDDHTAYLESGRTYLLLLESLASGNRTITATVQYIGKPSALDGITLTEQWQDVFIWWDGYDKLPIVITEPGEYYVELEWTLGQEDVTGYFYTPLGEWCDSFKYVSINGEETRVYMLDAGEYYIDLDVYANRYFSGRIRLVSYAKRTVEESEIEIPSDSYLTVSTSDLQVTFSTSSFSFELSEEAVLYCSTDSDYFVLYDEQGNRVIIPVFPTVYDTEYGVEAMYSPTLKPGRYTIVFTIYENTSPGVKTARVRLSAV